MQLRWNLNGPRLASPSSALYSYVVVYALDFSKAFDSVRHSAVLDKFSLLSIPDHVYNWIEAFFRNHSHCTKFNGETYDFLSILASIIQGSAIGPASYVCYSLRPAPGQPR